MQPLFFQSNRNNNNNNNSTANHNHNHIHSSTSIMSHKSVITTLKPVEEAEGPFSQRGCLDDWARMEHSPKQITSPLQEDYMDMNGPPGGFFFFVVLLLR